MVRPARPPPASGADVRDAHLPGAAPPLRSRSFLRRPSSGANGKTSFRSGCTRTAPNMIVGGCAVTMMFFAAVLTVHLVRRKISGSVDRKNVMSVSISFQFLSTLQKLEHLRETMPQLPRIHFVETFAHRSVRRHATDTVQRRQIEPPRQNARPRRTSKETDTSCRTQPSLTSGNPSDSALGSDLQCG